MILCKKCGHPVYETSATHLCGMSSGGVDNAKIIFAPLVLDWYCQACGRKNPPWIIICPCTRNVTTTAGDSTNG